MQRHAGLERLLTVSGLLGDANDCGTSQPLAYDGAGRLYAYGKDHVLRSVSVREQLLGDLAQEAAEDNEVQQDEQRVRLLQPDPALPCDAERLHVNRAGTYALVYGHGSDGREDGSPALHVISLTQREEDAVATPLEDALLVDRPGLQILQAAWHPGSDVHFATLTSDNIFRLYHVDDLSSPEQQVELRLRERQPLGLTDMEGSQAAAFAFGSLHLWERFAVFFACSDGKLFVVTPIAPFGCAVPASALHRLHAHTDAATEAASRSCTRAWLQQAFPSLGHADTGSALGSVTCHPASLDEHAPALQGPLHLTAPGGARHDSLLDFLDADDDVVACQMLGGGGAVGCLAVGTAGAAVGLLAIADAVQPRWAPQPPQATLDSSGSIVSTRSQAVRDATDAPQLLLLDMVQLQQEEAGQHASATPLQLLPSRAESDSLYAAHASGVVAVKLLWLPRLAALVSGADGDSSDRAPLPATAVQEICSPSAPITGVSVIGDALLGAAVVAADASGGLHCLAPAVGAAAQLLRQPQSPAAASPTAPAHSPDVEAAVTEHFGQLLSQPASGGIVPDGPRYAGTPDGQRALADAVAALRERHVEFAHAAHHDLLQHAKRLQGNAADQERQLAQLQRQAARLAEAAAAQEQQLQRATDLHDNLDARFRLLASLHWSLPQPMSAAEATFSAEDLPVLERIAADLKRKCQDAASRVNAAQDAAAAQPRLQTQQPPALPPSQVRRVREALGEQAAVLVANRAKARAIADYLAAEV